MRKSTRKKIMELQTEIARLIELEKKYWDKKNPDAHSLHRQIAHTQIEFMIHAPRIRETFQLQGGRGYEYNYD
ncbi:MAG TPA: hypothetical protein VFM18_04305 [Methanosarcina sp.]|nr:hypothetical protein [Methanosarcina sp.]